MFAEYAGHIWSLLNAVTIVFAYVAAAYFAASKLSRWQIISITFVYTIFLVLPASSALSSASQRLSTQKWPNGLATRPSQKVRHQRSACFSR